MTNTVLKAENISKQYRLGTVGTGTLSHDINRWWHSLRGKDDPYLQVGAVNDRGAKRSQEYVWALRDINFEVKQGEVLGIIGKNGAGKSTLLKILSRVTAPTTGCIKTKGRIASLLEVGTGFHPELTGRENIYLNGAILGMTKPEIKLKIDEIIAFSGCEMYIDTPTKRYSSGMTVRLAFAVAAHLEPEILVVDEVLAVGDAEFQQKAIGKMQDISQGEGRTVLFVSHNMTAVKELCQRVLIIEKGKIIQNGEPKFTIDKYLGEQNFENYSNPNVRRELITGKGPKLESSSIQKNNGEFSSSFSAGDNLKIKLKIKGDKSFNKKFAIVWFIQNGLNENIAVFSSGKMSNKYFDSTIDQVVDFEIETTALVPGIYYFRFVLHRPGEENYDDWKRALCFIVQEHDIFKTGYNYGNNWYPKTYLKTRWLS